MNKADIAMIVLIASMSMLVAYFGARAVIGDPDSESVTVKTIEQIHPEVEEPDPRVFNERAINPTVEVVIGDSESASGQ